MKFDSLSTKFAISDKNITNFENIERNKVFLSMQKNFATLLNQDREIFLKNVHIIELLFHIVISI